jgi:hypothetical protein
MVSKGRIVNMKIGKTIQYKLTRLRASETEATGYVQFGEKTRGLKTPDTEVER